MMEMHQIRYFLALVDELNFTRAARFCNVAQPSLTRAIKLLEAEFGGPLFHRERENTHLTELGLMVRPHIEETYKSALVARDVAANYLQGGRTNLKLGIMCTIPPDQLIYLISVMYTRYKNINLQLADGTGPNLNEKLLAGELDIAIYCTGMERPDHRLNIIPLYREPMVIAVGREHPLAQKGTVEIRDLQGQRYLQRINCEFTGQLSPIMRAQNVKVELVHRSDRDDWIVSLIAAGLGYGFMPESCVGSESVVSLRLSNPEIWRHVNLATVRGREYSPGVGAIVREAMRTEWRGQPALALQYMTEIEEGI